MTYTDFIAVIDLGTSHMVGMVGTKNENGVLSIIAYDVEKSESCIRRGCVYNVEETANKIKRLILKLENKLSGSKIGKIYIGVGSKSIRTIDHTVSKVLGAEGEVTSDRRGAARDAGKNHVKFWRNAITGLALETVLWYVKYNTERLPLSTLRAVRGSMKGVCFPRRIRGAAVWRPAV